MMRTLLLTLAGATVTPSMLLACPVCFGASDGPMLQGSNMGVLALLIVTLGMLGVFGVFFRTLARRAAAAAAQPQARATRPQAGVTP